MPTLHLVPRVKEDKPRPLTELEEARVLKAKLDNLARCKGKTFEPRKKAKDKVVRVVEFIHFDDPEDAA